jgi:hypothetical protein
MSHLFAVTGIFLLLPTAAFADQVRGRGMEMNFEGIEPHRGKSLIPKA